MVWSVKIDWHEYQVAVGAHTNERDAYAIFENFRIKCIQRKLLFRDKFLAQIIDSLVFSGDSRNISQLI